MSEHNTNWTQDELKAYILIVCANADFVESKSETDFIKSIISEDSYQRLHSEFESDNDYQSIEKIKNTINRFGYSHDEIELIFNDIKKLFLIDGNFDILEKNLYNGLHHILSK